MLLQCNEESISKFHSSKLTKKFEFEIFAFLYPTLLKILSWKHGLDFATFQLFYYKK